MIAPAPQAAPSATEASPQTHRGPFIMMTVLFFMWGFMTVWNDVLIPRFKEAFSLSYFQAMLVQFAFFGAYAVGALAYYLIALCSGDPINRMGYKNGVVLGLSISAIGSALFYPAASLLSYPFFLCALFVVGLGFALLQIAANPYITILGPERTASSRLNLSQAFNSLGTTTGPVLGGWLIFTFFTRPGQHGAESVKLPYLILSIVFALLAIGFAFAKLPAFKNTESVQRGTDILHRPHFLFGVGAIFMYVGAEVSTGSALVNLLGLPSMGGLTHQQASHYLAFYWGGLMVGRLMAAFSLSDLKPALRRSLQFVIPFVAFVVVLLIDPMTSLLTQGQLPSWLAFTTSATTTDALSFGVLLMVLLIAFLVGGATPARMLSVFGLINITLLLIGMFGQGEVAKWCVLGVGLFCSVMWSNIFSLAIEGLGPLKSQASSLLVMAILGGALLPPLQGGLADLVGIQASFLVPVLAFGYVAFYGIIGHRIGSRSAT